VQPSIEVDPRFREFYDTLGGADVFGVAISPKFNRDGLEYQYTAAALMVYNPMAERSQQLYLAPIGIELGIAEFPVNAELQNEHPIYPGFRDMYNVLGGEAVVGLPLTNIRYNAEKGCIEQYFENLGFFHDDSAPDREVRLLHYGAWMCATSCGYDSPASSQVNLPSVVETPFAEATSRLNPHFSGRPLTEPYTAPDGQVEQIFENVVVVADANKPGGIALRPIPAMLGVAVQYDGNFEVPRHFSEYLSQNSGPEFSGPAVTEYKKQSDELYRQCFANLCLDYFPSRAKELQVRLTSLGYVYKNRYYQEYTEDLDSEAVREVTLKVWEGYPVIPPNKSQSIGVAVYYGTQPLPDIAPVLTLTLPDGSIVEHTYEPTRADGKSFFEIEPIDAPHGTSIGYSVCVDDFSSQEICVVDEFLVWGNP
jgi:hypothetical protein